jgi:hypothetical protein
MVEAGERPGRRGRLPARAPLRTVLESFPSYGSSPHKASHILWPTRCLTRDKSRSDNLAILTGSRSTLCSFEATAPGRINRRASVVICVPGIGRFHWLSWFFAVSSGTGLCIRGYLTGPPRRSLFARFPLLGDPSEPRWTPQTAEPLAPYFSNPASDRPASPTGVTP